jgi:hypothetical protein
VEGRSGQLPRLTVRDPEGFHSITAPLELCFGPVHGMIRNMRGMILAIIGVSAGGEAEQATGRRHKVKGRAG